MSRRTTAPGDGARSRSRQKTMRAMVISEFGPPDVLRLRHVPVPSPRAGEVLVRVHAVSVAHTRDVDTRGGRGPVFPKAVTFPHILGGEHVGIVVGMGPDVPEDVMDARVAVAAPIYCGICHACEAGAFWDCIARSSVGIDRPGSNAEYTVVPATNLDRLPHAMPFVQAAALAPCGPLAQAQLDVANAQRGDWVLILGASGAVGTAGVALAAQRGARVIALTRGQRAAPALRSLGAELVLDVGRPDLTDAILAHTSYGVNVVVDNVTLVDLWESYWPALARSARVVISGRAGESDRPLPLNVVELYRRRLSVMGITMNDRRDVTTFWRKMRARPLALPADLIETFTLEQTARAHERTEKGEKIGHFVLTVA